MRLAVIVSEFPKTSETFILRDLLAFHDLGAEIRLYYLAPYRTGETLHDFARPVLDWVHHEGMASRRSLAAFGRACRHRPRVMAGILGDCAKRFSRDPELMAKTAALLPKIAAIAEDAMEWGAEHVHACFAAHPATAAWAIGRLSGIPYSVSCHAYDIFTTQAMLDRKLGEAAFVRTISDFNKDFLLSKLPGLPAEHIQVIRCGMDLRVLQPLPTRSRGERLNLLYVGRLAAEKGVDVLLRALAMPDADPSWRLDVVGDGPLRGKLEALSGKLGLGSRVTWHGSQRFEALAGFYDRAEAVVVPSIIGPGGRTEGIPNVLMEALAHCRPVVASKVSGVHELVVDGQTGVLVPPSDPAALVRAVRRIADDPASAQAMAVAGRRLVERNYDLSVTTVQQFETLRRHLVGTHPGCDPMVAAAQSPG